MKRSLNVGGSIIYIYIYIYILVLVAFRLYDLDRDGYVSRDELLRIVDALYRMVLTI